MKPPGFNALVRSLSARLSRRTALRATGLAGAAGVLAVVAASPVSAQDGTASPDAFSEDASFLFVQSATSGTFTPNPGAGTPVAHGTPVAGGGADYLLTLDGHTGSTVYFSDRPDRIFGEAPTQTFLDSLGFSPGNPPNAALVISDEQGNEDILVVELLSPIYDAGAGSVSYGVNLLSDYQGGLDFVARRQQDENLAPSFGTASLFIDDCPDVDGCYVQGGGSTNFPFTSVGPIPSGINTGQCWHWSPVGCSPCSGWSEQQFEDACNGAYSACDDNCVVFTGSLA